MPGGSRPHFMSNLDTSLPNVGTNLEALHAFLLTIRLYLG
jgi:hypothetical protein